MLQLVNWKIEKKYQFGDEKQGRLQLENKEVITMF